MTARDRTYVLKNRDKGVHCPTCDQYAKVYRWSLYRTAAKALILLHDLGGETEYVSTRQLKEHGHKGQGDCSRLQKWGLVEEEKNRREDGGRSGYWRISKLGLRFLSGRMTIPKYIFVYNNEVIATDGPPVKIHDALGEKFDLRQIRAVR